MKGSHFITISSVVLAAASVAYSAGRSAQSPAAAPQPVTVTNSTSQCVPTSIYHSIALPAVQSGPWNVGAIADKLPFERYSSVTLSQGTDGNSDVFTVPSGKRLVLDAFAVESVASGNFSAGPTHLQIYRLASNGITVLGAWYESLSLNTVDGVSDLSGPMHLTAEPGEKISVTIMRTSAYDSYPTTGSYTLVGHYVVLP